MGFLLKFGQNWNAGKANASGFFAGLFIASAIIGYMDAHGWLQFFDAYCSANHIDFQLAKDGIVITLASGFNSLFTHFLSPSQVQTINEKAEELGDEAPTVEYSYPETKNQDPKRR